jgi:uncharacterized membrane protein
MPDAQHSVTINLPVETVFAYVLDGETGSSWRPGVVDIKRVSGDGAGAIYRQGVKGPMGRRIDADYTVTHAEANRIIEFQTIAGPVRPRGRYEFELVGPNTRVTFTLRAELSGLRGLLLGSMVQNTMNAEVKTLDRLKQVLES